MSHHHKHHHHHNKDHEQHHHGSLILVVGVGHIGGEIAKYLAENGDKVRVLFRKESLNKPIVEELKKHGAEIFEGNVEDPKSLEASLEGVAVVVSSLSNPQHSGILIAAAKKAKVQLFIPSLHVADNAKVTKEELIAKEPKDKIVQDVKDSGLNHIIIWTAFWTNNLAFNGFSAKAEMGGDHKISFIHTKDIAALYHLIIHDKALLNKTINLSHEKLTQEEILALFEKNGKKLEVVKVTEQDLKDRIAKKTQIHLILLVF